MKSLLSFINETLKSYDNNKLINDVKKNFKEYFYTAITNKKHGNISGVNFIFKWPMKIESKSIDRSYTYNGKKHNTVATRKTYDVDVANILKDFKKFVEKYGYEITLCESVHIDNKDRAVEWAKLSKEEQTEIDDLTSYDRYETIIGNINKDELLKITDDEKNIKEYQFDDIFVEPKYSENITKYIKNECDGKIYHFTRDADKIISSKGLRCKKSEATVLMHAWSERIYFIYAPQEKIQKAWTSIINEFGTNIKHYDLLEIDISSLNIDLYKDTYSKTDCACYGFTNIPLKYIKKVNFEKKGKEYNIISKEEL